MLRPRSLSAVRILILLALGLMVVVAPARAQRSVLQPNVIIRFRDSVESRREQGIIVRTVPDTLWVGRCGRNCIAPFALRDLVNVQRFERAPASGRRRLAGTAIGVGLASALLAGTALTCGSSNDGPGCGVVLLALPEAALVGGAVGFAMTSLIGKQRWVPVDLSRE